jgi:heme oxygenase
MKFFEHLQERTKSARGELLAIPVIEDAVQGRVELRQYLAFLEQAYHHVRHTTPLLMACGSRLPDRLDWLRPAVARYIGEEIGHDEWILSDIAACGGCADDVRRGRPAFATELMVAYAYHQVDRRNPVGLFGMVHVLEGTSIAIATSAAQAIQRSLRLPAGAFTYLASHGSLDREHVKFFESLMNRIEAPDDRAAIVDCAIAIYRLYGDIFRALPRRGGSGS